jgi:hypothetical protein
MRIDINTAARFVEQLYGVRPADDTPTPPGPWWPIIRTIVNERFEMLTGPRPEPWQNGQRALLWARWSLAALNPQPLPPLPAMLIEALVSRAELLADIGQAIDKPGMGSDFIRAMVEDLCPPPRKIPIPPRPYELVISAADLVFLGAGLREAAAWTAHAELRSALEEFGGRGMEVGLEALGQGG